MHKEKAGLCILSKESMPIARFKHMLIDYTADWIFTPKSLLFEGEDIGNIDKGCDLNISAVNDIKKLSDRNFIIDDSENISEKVLAYIDSHVKHRESKKINLFNKGVEKEQQPIKKNEYLHNFNIPVVTVMGMGEQCNKFEIQLALREHFLNAGYKVSQIGTKEYSELFGFSAIPDFIYSPVVSAETKIYMFNEYAYKIVNEEKPDILVLGIPGGIMKFNERTVNHFSEAAFVINNAVTSDISILSIYYDDYDEEDFKKLSDYCNYKFDSKIDFFNISNTKINFQAAKYKKPIEYLTVSSAEILNQIESLNSEYQLFNVLSEKNYYGFCSKIESMLSDNTVFV